MSQYCRENINGSWNMLKVGIVYTTALCSATSMGGPCIPKSLVSAPVCTYSAPVPRLNKTVTLFTPSAIACSVSSLGPSTVFPLSVGPQLALYISMTWGIWLIEEASIMSVINGWSSIRIPVDLININMNYAWPSPRWNLSTWRSPPVTSILSHWQLHPLSNSALAIHISPGCADPAGRQHLNSQPQQCSVAQKEKELYC